MLDFLKALFVAPGERIGVDEARSRQAAGALLLDVREPGEFGAGHAPGAVNLPLSRLRRERARAVQALPQARIASEVLLVCHSGARSRMAQALLKDDRRHRYVDVAGGMTAWKRARLPLGR